MGLALRLFTTLFMVVMLLVAGGELFTYLYFFYMFSFSDNETLELDYYNLIFFAYTFVNMLMARIDNLI